MGYEQSKMGRYIRQRANANRRKVVWNLTFPEWEKLWEDSGKWELRGRGVGQYCMARKHDLGSYEVGNVEIIPSVKNSAASFKTFMVHYRPKAAVPVNVPRVVTWEHIDYKPPGLYWQHPTPLEAYPNGYIF